MDHYKNADLADSNQSICIPCLIALVDVLVLEIPEEYLSRDFSLCVNKLHPPTTTRLQLLLQNSVLQTKISSDNQAFNNFVLRTLIFLSDIT